MSRPPPAGKGYIVAAVGEAGGEVPYTSYIARRSWLNENEETAKGFLRAILRGVEYAQTQDADTIAQYLLDYFPSTSLQSIATSVTSYRNIDAWVTDMAMTEESFERLQDIIESAGELSERADFAALVDNTYVREVYAALK